MIDFIKWYFEIIFEDEEGDSRIMIWVSRICGILISPLVVFTALVLYVLVTIGEIND